MSVMGVTSLFHGFVTRERMTTMHLHILMDLKPSRTAPNNVTAAGFAEGSVDALCGDLPKPPSLTIDVLHLSTRARVTLALLPDPVDQVAQFIGIRPPAPVLLATSSAHSGESVQLFR